jgi:Rhodopirellula transposase DDE domain
LVSAATGLAPETIRKGRRELAVGDGAAAGRIRRPGAGRPNLEQDQPGLTAALERLVDPLTRGDPTSPLRWTCKSRAQLTAALTADGWRVSSSAVGRLRHALGYRLQALRKTREGRQHPDRNAQFEHINATAASFLQHGQPVISVDTKKKELVGEFKTAGREWQPTQTPEQVQVHDFPTQVAGKAIPYGVYDMARNEAWVSVGRDHDTSAFAVAAIRQWWGMMGRAAYPAATHLLITADAGGSNGYRTRAWKTELQRLADALKLRITVCHFPPVRASGTRSSIGSSVTSPQTGEAACSGRSTRSSPDRPHEHGDRIARASEAGQGPVSHRRQGLCGGDARRRAASSRLSRRLELRDPSTHNLITQF